MNGPFTEADARASLAHVLKTGLDLSAEFVEQQLALLNAAYRSAASRPDGWVACPKEPDLEILFAQNKAATSVEAYRAMLAASPYALKDEGR